MSDIHERPEMSNHRIRRLLALALLGALVAWGLLSHGTARADGIINATESNYIATYGDFVVCASLDGAPTPTTVLAVASAIMEDGFATDSAADIIVASVALYCDEYWPLLQRIGGEKVTAA